MELTYRFNIPLYDRRIDYQSRLMFVGSCFADNIGGNFARYKFCAQVNPFGVLFNPVSLFSLLERVLEQKQFSKSDFIFYNQKWISPALHGMFSHPDLDTALIRINSQIALQHQNLKKLTHLFLTFGTAWAYRYRESGLIVANCHKIPQEHFEKILLSPDWIVERTLLFLEKFRQINPSAAVILTVSPVRHGKDGAFDNNVSKGSLLLAVKKIIEQAEVDYFPAFEIVMDELRDYRFYGPDFSHPNDLAVQYIWERVRQVFIAKEAESTLKKVEEILRGLAHRHSDTSSAAYRAFMADLASRMESVSVKDGAPDFFSELEQIRNLVEE